MPLHKGSKKAEEKKAINRIAVVQPSSNNLPIQSKSELEAGLRRRSSKAVNFDKNKKMKEELKMLEFMPSHARKAILAKKTRFSIEQVEALIKIYQRLISVGKMDRLRFKDTLYSIFQISNDLILDRIFGVFDKGTSGSITETDWVIGMSTFLRGNLEEQIAYAYEVYDIDGDHKIGREEVSQFLQNCISPIHGVGMQAIEPEEVEECCRDITEIVMKKLDEDGNGLIDYKDFHAGVVADPTLLEALGPCLPTPDRVKVFLSIFAEDYWNFSTNFSNPLDPGWSLEVNKFARKAEITAKRGIIRMRSPMRALTYLQRRNTNTTMISEVSKSSVAPKAQGKQPSLAKPKKTIK